MFFVVFFFFFLLLLFVVVVVVAVALAVVVVCLTTGRMQINKQTSTNALALLTHTDTHTASAPLLPMIA